MTSLAQRQTLLSLIDEAVAAEHLHGVRADLGAVRGGEGPGRGDRRRGVLAPVEAAGRPPRRRP